MKLIEAIQLIHPHTSKGKIKELVKAGYSAEEVIDKINASIVLVCEVAKMNYDFDDGK